MRDGTLERTWSRIMNQLHEHLVALSQQSSYNHHMNDTLNTIVTLILLTPLLLVCAGLVYDLVSSRKSQHEALFGSVHPDER